MVCYGGRGQCHIDMVKMTQNDGLGGAEGYGWVGARLLDTFNGVLWGEGPVPY